MQNLTPSILITDDDSSLRETLQEIFIPQGFHTLTAADGQEALDIVQENDVHLILMDINMPRLSGLDTLKQVKKFKNRLPCILMSANHNETLVQQAMLAQAFTVLAKPLSIKMMMDNVLQAIRTTYNWDWKPLAR